METLFKAFFFMAIIVFILLVIGLFLVMIKILLLFYPEVRMMGILFSKAL